MENNVSAIFTNAMSDTELLRAAVERESHKEDVVNTIKTTQRDLDNWSPHKYSINYEAAGWERPEYAGPVLMKVKRTYPEPVPHVTLNPLKAFWPIILISMFLMYHAYGVADFTSTSIVAELFSTLLTLVAVPAAIIYSIYYVRVIHRRHKQEEVRRIVTSYEYQAQCAKLNQEYYRQDQEFRAKYEVELAAFKEKQNAKIAEYSAKLKQLNYELKCIETELASLYGVFNKIPEEFRTAHDLKSISTILEHNGYADANLAIRDYDLVLEREAAQEEAAREREWARAEARRSEREAEYHERNSSSDSLGFAGTVAAAAIGSAIANHGIKKELKRQDAAEQEYRRQQEFEKKYEQIKEDMRKSSENYIERTNIIRMNVERRSKGLPELPVPPVHTIR